MDTSTALDTEVSAVAAEAALVEAARRRLRGADHDNDRLSGLLTGASFIAVSGVWLALAPPRTVPVGMFVACVAVFVVAASVEFEIGPGSALPTMPVQVVMLFVLPPALVPVAVVCGLGGAALLGRLVDRQRRERVLVLAGSGWQAVGPAAVFALAHTTRPAWSDWPVYVAALLAQFALDSTASWVRNCYGLGVPTRQLAAALQFTFLCDLCLAPIGVAAVLAAPRSLGALAFLVPLCALLALLQADRRRQIDKTLALGAAFNDTSRLARCDALTGAANRLAWEERTAHLELSDAPIGVVLADVDGLKTANDTYGHARGDQLLLAVTRTITDAIAPNSDATVFRIGGDEFAVLLPGATHASLTAVAGAIRDALHAAPALDGLVPVSASIGTGHAHCGAALGRALATADHSVNHEKDSRGVRRR